jgi:hypothetical protein
MPAVNAGENSTRSCVHAMSRRCSLTCKRLAICASKPERELATSNPIPRSHHVLYATSQCAVRGSAFRSSRPPACVAAALQSPQHSRPGSSGPHLVPAWPPTADTALPRSSRRVHYTLTTVNRHQVREPRQIRSCKADRLRTPSLQSQRLKQRWIEETHAHSFPDCAGALQCDRKSVYKAMINRRFLRTVSDGLRKQRIRSWLVRRCVCVR